MKKTAALLAVVLYFCGFALTAAHADSLKGSVVRAELVFGDDPNINGNPTNLLTGGHGFRHTREVVGSGKEYMYDDGIATYSANFNLDQLIIRVKCDDTITLKKCNKEPGFVWAFEDAAFEDYIVTPDPASTLLLLGGFPAPDILIAFDPLSADTTGDFLLTGRNTKFILDFTPAPVPEPGSIALLGTGLLGITTTLRRRILASTRG